MTRTETDAHGSCYEAPTLRDQFAMAALTGLSTVADPTDPNCPANISVVAFAYADAMMAERSKGKP